MYKNVASQKIAVFAWDGANGTAKTGDAGNITAEISKDGAASVASNDTNPTELDVVDHPGIYIFDLLQAETNCDLFVLTPDSSTTDIVFRPVIINTNPITPIKVGYIDHSIATVDGVVDAIKAKTDNLKDAWNDITAAAVWAVATRALTDKAGFSLSNSGIDAILDEVVEGTVTLRQAMRLILSILTAKSSGGGSDTITFRDIGDLKDRLIATVDSAGNRTTIDTRDGS